MMSIVRCTVLLQAVVDSSVTKDVPGNSGSKTQTNVAKRRLALLQTFFVHLRANRTVSLNVCMFLFASRTRPSPKKSAKKLHLDEDTVDGDGDGGAGGATVAAESRYLLPFGYGFMFSCCALF
jgi:hypothetical protein